MPLIYIEQSYVRKLELDQAKVKKIASIMSDLWGDTDRGDNPQIDQMFDLLDDLLGIEGKDRCDYIPD